MLQSFEDRPVLREQLFRLVETLTDRERAVVEQRLGLIDGYPRTLEEVGRQFRITTAKVEEIQRQALRKIAKGLVFSEEASVAEALLESLVTPHVEPGSEVVETVKTLTPHLIQHLRLHSEDLVKLPWPVFEHLVAEFLANQGFAHVALVGRNAETAADIFAAHYIPALSEPVRVFVEVKRWKQRIGMEVINTVYGAMLQERSVHGWHAAMVIGLSGYASFRRSTPTQLAKCGIELKCRDDLLKWLQDYRQHPSGLWVPIPATSIEDAMRRRIDSQH